MNDFTLLTEEQIFSSDRLTPIQKYGETCSSTDFAILLGNVALNSKFFNRNLGYIGAYWTKTKTDNVMVVAVSEYNRRKRDYPNERFYGARPAIKYSTIKGHVTNKNINKDGILEIEYGEYPQYAVDSNIQEKLTETFNKKIMKPTGKNYTLDLIDIEDTKTKFSGIKFHEYEYHGKKYINFAAHANSHNAIINDFRKVKLGDEFWIEVTPIKWFVDEEADIAFSEKILFSGIQFCTSSIYDGNFEITNIKWYLDKYFSKEIIPSKKPMVTNVSNTRKNSPYNFDFDKVTEEEIIRGAVESNIAVFLHGRSSEGKSARVRQIDPDAEIIYLRNTTPDSLNGKSVYNSSTNEMIDIPPTWYKKLVKKCEEEPDKIHIVFFDEITNALPSIQGMAFNIVLDGEVNGKWKLPPNARIVASGNDLEDSKAANEMAKPLFNRFAHVYINTTVDSWLKWASTPIEEYQRLDYKKEEVPRKIHPSIYAYIAYKSYSKQDVLRTEYNGKTPNADPRKWEMASKILYSTGKPEMLRALIGDSLTRDFIRFVKEQVLTVEDVINGNYTEDDLILNKSEKYNTAVGLSSVDEEHIEVVRNFVMKLGAEICAMFDTLWANGDKERLKRIVELNLSEQKAK